MRASLLKPSGPEAHMLTTTWKVPLKN